MKPIPHLLIALALGWPWVASPSVASQGPNAAANPVSVASAPRDWSEPPDFEALRAAYVARAAFPPCSFGGLDLSAKR